MSTLLDSQGRVHIALIAKGENNRTLCTPTGVSGDMMRSGRSVDCPGCVTVDDQINTFTGPRYDVFMNGSLMGGGSTFRSGLASAVRVSLRYPTRLFRLHDDVDTDQPIVEVRDGAIENVLVPF